MNPEYPLLNDITRARAPDDAPGVKHDAEKPDPTLLPPRALLAVVRVLGFGARKYPSRDNWKGVPNARQRYLAAALRHLLALLAGEERDPETGESHAAHACTCLLFYLGFVEGDAPSNTPNP